MERNRFNKTFNLVRHFKQTGNYEKVSSKSYFNLFQEEWHLKLPNWTDVVYPETLYKMASKNYLILSGTTELKQIGSGFFLTFTSVELVVIVTFKVICFKKLFMTHS
jgi:hypothetical protein